MQKVPGPTCCCTTCPIGDTAPNRAHCPAGDYGLDVDAQLVASVERKSLADLVSSLINGRLRFQVADLASLPRAAVVVEDRYSQVFKTGPGPPGAGRRRPGRTTGPVAEGADRLL